MHISIHYTIIINFEQILITLYFIAMKVLSIGNYGINFPMYGVLFQYFHLIYNRLMNVFCIFSRSDIFELFDMIMLLSQGNIVYYGKANQMVEYFTELGYPCPELTNPCDFYGLYILIWNFSDTQI